MTSLGSSASRNLGHEAGERETCLLWQTKRTRNASGSGESDSKSLSYLVTDLVQRRAVWWTLQAVFHNNPTLPPSGLFDFIAINYMESESIGVRRLLDNDGRTSSLMVLLDLQRSVELLTRDRFVVASGWRDQVFASSRFDRFVGEPGHVHVPASRVQSDIDMLRNASAVVKKYSDKRIAHWDKTPPNTLPTFSDLHNAVAAIGICVSRMVWVHHRK